MIKKDIDPRMRLYTGLFLAVFAAAFTLYISTVTYPFINWDDDYYIIKNHLIRAFNFHTIAEIFTRGYEGLYIPLTYVSYALDYVICGQDAGGYRMTNIAIHAVNSGLVLVLLLFLTRNTRVSFFTALVFAAHPLQVESVVWIAERKNVLSTLFFLLSLLSHAYARLGNFQGSRRSPAQFVRLALFFCALGLLSKPVMVMMPIVIIAFDLAWNKFSWKNTPLYAAYFLAAGLFAGMTIFTIDTDTHWQYYGGSFLNNFRVTLVVLMEYFRLLFYPVHLSLFYMFPVYQSFREPEVMLAIAGLVMLAALLALLWKCGEKQWVFWLSLYFIFLFPVLNIIPSTTLMNDRYMYIPIIGIFCVLFSVLEKFAGKRALILIAVLLLIYFVNFNLKRQKVWSDREHFWLAAQESVGEKHWVPYANLGFIYLEEQEGEKALLQFEKAARIDPQNPLLLNGKAQVLVMQGDLAGAEKLFIAALERDPRMHEVYNSLGILYGRQGKLARSIPYFRKALEKQPHQADYHFNMGISYYFMNKKDKAREQFNRALSIDPKHWSSMEYLQKLDKGESAAGNPT